MVKLFDSTFVLGSALVIASLVVAALALTRDDVPIIGTGALALVAVAAITFGTVLGVAALLLIAAGLLGWTAVLDPIARFVPGQASAAMTPARTAIFALAVLIGVKWLVAIGMAATAR